MSETIELSSTPIDTLVAGELSWKDYISSLTPEDLERQRRYDRAKASRWYQENKEAKKAYCKEYQDKNKDKRSEQHTCDKCNGHYNLKTKWKHHKTKKHQDALSAEAVKPTNH